MAVTLEILFMFSYASVSIAFVFLGFLSSCLLFHGFIWFTYYLAFKKNPVYYYNTRKSLKKIFFLKCENKGRIFHTPETLFFSSHTYTWLGIQYHSTFFVVIKLTWLSPFIENDHGKDTMASFLSYSSIYCWNFTADCDYIVFLAEGGGWGII